MSKSPYPYANFVGRTLCHRKTGEAYLIVGYVGSYQFIVTQDGSDVEMFVPIRKLHHYVMLPSNDLAHDISADELSCADAT